MARTEREYSGAVAEWTAFAACALLCNDAFDSIAGLDGISNVVVGCLLLLAVSALLSGDPTPWTVGYPRSRTGRRPHRQGATS